MRDYLDEPMKRVALRGRLLRPWWKLRFAEFGSHSVIDRPTWIYGPGSIAVGERVVILPGAWLSAERETWSRDAPSITIGSGSVFRTGLVLSATTGIEIEENVLCAAGVSIIDCDHTLTGQDVNPLHNPKVSEPIKIGRGSWLGERVTVTRGVEIGRRCIVGAHSVVRDSIPDGSVAVGTPARVVGRVDDAAARSSALETETQR